VSDERVCGRGTDDKCVAFSRETSASARDKLLTGEESSSPSFREGIFEGAKRRRGIFPRGFSRIPREPHTYQWQAAAGMDKKTPVKNALRSASSDTIVRFHSRFETSLGMINDFPSSSSETRRFAYLTRNYFPFARRLVSRVGELFARFSGPSHLFFPLSLEVAALQGSSLASRNKIRSPLWTCAVRLQMKADHSFWPISQR